MKTKTKLLTILLSLLSINLFAQNKISSNAQNYIDAFMNFRMELTVYQNDKPSALKAIKSYKTNNPYSSFSEQERIIIDSLFSLEDYHYSRDVKAEETRLQKMLLAQVDINEKFIDNNKDNVSSWLYVITADAISSYMSFNPISGAMKYGLKVKKYYEKCLELDPKHSYCLTHIAQWYYWAPAINGGSIKKAINFCNSAIPCARNTAEKFYAEIFLSQMLYENKDKASCAEHLKKALSYFPKSKLVPELQSYNAQGYSLFTYDKKKAEEQNRMN